MASLHDKSSHRLLERPVQLHGTDTVCLIDSGATHCFVSVQLVNDLDISTHKGESLQVTLADNKTVITSDLCATIPLKFSLNSEII